MSRLTREMDAAFARGRARAASGNSAREPFALPKYTRWAYNAGFAEGAADFAQLAANIDRTLRANERSRT
jgi:hypothetical protein